MHVREPVKAAQVYCKANDTILAQEAGLWRNTGEKSKAAPAPSYGGLPILQPSPVSRHSHVYCHTVKNGGRE